MRNSKWKRAPRFDQIWLSRDKKRPTEERMEEMKDYFWDTEVVRIYCDCSLSPDRKVAGLAAAFIGLGSSIVRSKKSYSLSPMTSVKNELRAVIYALEELPLYLSQKEKEMDKPKTVIIYSDLAQINDALLKLIWTNKQDLSLLIDDILHKRYILSKTINLDIKYLEASERKYNPYYSSAHNSARKIINNR